MVSHVGIAHERKFLNICVDSLTLNTGYEGTTGYSA